MLTLATLTPVPCRSCLAPFLDRYFPSVLIPLIADYAAWPTSFSHSLPCPHIKDHNLMFTVNDAGNIFWEGKDGNIYQDDRQLVISAVVITRIIGQNTRLEITSLAATDNRVVICVQDLIFSDVYYLVIVDYHGKNRKWKEYKAIFDCYYNNSILYLVYVEDNGEYNIVTINEDLKEINRVKYVSDTDTSIYADKDGSFLICEWTGEQSKLVRVNKDSQLVDLGFEIKDLYQLEKVIPRSNGIFCIYGDPTVTRIDIIRDNKPYTIKVDDNSDIASTYLNISDDSIIFINRGNREEPWEKRSKIEGVVHRLQL